VRVTRHPLTPLANADELAYREEAQLREPQFATVEAWFEGVDREGVLDRLPWLLRRGWVPAGEGIDLGAGSGWLTAQLSALPNVEHVHALDFSETQLTKIGPHVIERCGGVPEKVSLHVADMHDLGMFGDGSMGFVAAAAVLHHAVDLDRVLRECRRVLRPDGLLLALSEPGIPRIVTPLTREQGEEGFGARERAHGVTERTYRESEWRAAFQRAGFEVRFLRNFDRRGNWRAELVRRTPLRWTNGLLFWAKTIVARPAPLRTPLR
jgi:ubiquinone/menaquinone biosynthesis C-methylase UbiE